MRQYARALSTVLGGLESRSVIDFGAGTGWIRTYGFASYLALDAVPPDEPWAKKWNFDDALPEEYRRKYDVGVSLNTIQYAADPNRTLTYFLSALRAGGSLIVAAPWLYPPVDRAIDYWRIAPRALYRMTAPHFEKISLFLIGSMIDLPGRIGSRLLRGRFRGFSRVKKFRSEAKVLCPSNEMEIPTSFFGPLTALLRAENYILRSTNGGRGRELDAQRNDRANQ
jgi:SAM-dependent methyltransferase